MYICKYIYVSVKMLRAIVSFSVLISLSLSKHTQNTLTHSPTHIYTHSHTHTHSLSHSLTHSHTHTHTLSHSLTHTHTYTTLLFSLFVNLTKIFAVDPAREALQALSFNRKRGGDCDFDEFSHAKRSRIFGFGDCDHD